VGKKKKNNPSLDVLRSRVGKLHEELEKIRSGQVKINPKKETVVDCMSQIRDEIYELRVTHEASYSAIAKILKDTLDFEISERSLRNFCVEVLGCPSKNVERKTTDKEAAAEAAVLTQTITDKVEGEGSRVDVGAVGEADSGLPEQPAIAVFEHKQDLSLRKEKESNSDFGVLL